MTKQLAFALYIQNKINEIFNVLKPVHRARDLGVPLLGDSPFTEDLVAKYKQYQNASTVKECREYGDAVLEFMRGYFKVTFELISDGSLRADREVERIQTHTEQPIVALRDFDADPECANLVYTIATRFHGIASVQDLQNAHPEFYDRIPELINRINTLWLDIISIDPDNQLITLNNDDYQSICSLVNKIPIEPDHRLAKLIEKRNTEMGALYLILSEIAPEHYINYINKKIREYSNKDISEYPLLFSARSVIELRSIGIHTIIDFLTHDYSALRKKTTINKFELIEAKIRLASKMKWNCEKYDISIVHPSVAGDQTVKSLFDAVRHLRENFDRDNITYKDILDSKEIIISPKKSNVRRLIYRIIAFVRDFSKRCLEFDPFDFEPYPSNWNYTSHLTASELKTLKIKKDNSYIIGSLEDFSESEKSEMNQENEENMPSGLENNVENNLEKNQEIILSDNGEINNAKK